MIIWSLFDGSGLMGQPWADNGHTVYCFNADEGDHGAYTQYGCRVEHPNIRYINAWIDSKFGLKAAAGEWGTPDLIFAFPPCTDIAVSGARHFAAKLAANPTCQTDAVETARIAGALGHWFNVPYMIENPVSVMASLWRKPDFTFHPWEFSGYLPEGDMHPYFPLLIAGRDQYPKTTKLWTGNGFKHPKKIPVPIPPGYSEQFHKLGGKSAKTKTIRSLTPRGFARAVYEANKP